MCCARACRIECVDQFIFMQLSVVVYIEDITCPRVDMNFIFEWSTRYLTSERSELVRYRVDHEKIKFISISGHVIFCLLYKHQWNTKPFYFYFYYVTITTVISSHVKITCYLHVWRYEVFAGKLTWYFTGVYIINYNSSWMNWKRRPCKMHLKSDRVH